MNTSARFKQKCLLAIAFALALAGCGERASVAFRATDVTGVEWGRDFELQDHTGTTRRLADYKGKVLVLTFGYTTCPDICPTALATLAESMRLLGDDAARVQVAFVSVDPERDTADQLRGYVAWFDPSFVGLRGNEQATAATASAFHIKYRKQHIASAAGYAVDHTAGQFVFDAAGRLRLFVQHGETPEGIAHDIRLLLARH